MRSLIPFLLLLGFGLPVSGQDSLKQDPPRRDFRKIDLFPAISYAPETKLTLGVIGIYYMDLYKRDTNTQISNIQFLAVYTTARQLSILSEWEIFIDGNQWRFRGESFFDIFPDRNYGRGNSAGALIGERDADGSIDSLNYLRYNSNRLNFSPVVLRRIAPALYLGLRLDLEYLYNARPIPDNWRYLNADSARITQLPVDGLRVGLGLSVLYDTRDYVLNPLSGTFLDFRAVFFGPNLGSDFRFQNIRLDARQYINTWRNHTLAMRVVFDNRFSPNANEIPIRALSRVGGNDFMRGYFRGTYQDNHMLAGELEYRLPFWKESDTDPFWKVWKRLGIVGFVGAAQVVESWDRFRGDRFRVAAGGGLRILLNRESRASIRVDYAFGFAPDSNGPGRRQSGFYFYLAEAF